ncbi:flavodoxin [Orenia metallireducens]|jgi:hypothetical protein|uniref:Flavodoxin n=1 Tax=Orenia metallireducens TaxID=1413210 RepID=A0A285IB51_9FIRM|nr:flavodoxin [Orenia metallireducens]PRX20619.1 flavodoxin [Orenia metallireducens]SNY45205.1 Flavodoxin [Orenia metallireducens]
MKVDIYYYSRTGNCEQVAERLSDRIDSNLYRIADKGEGFKGLVGWFKGGYYAFRDKESDINFHQGDSEIICLITPVWAGKIPPAVRRFVNQFNFNGKEVYLLATMGGSEGQVFEVLERMLAKSGTKIIGRTAIKANDITTCNVYLDQLCSQL